MDSVFWRIRSWSLNFKKYKGRVVLRGDIVKDDSGSCAVFTEQGSSASQMTAAKIMDIIPRLPGCAWQAADAVYGNTQVKMEDAPTFFWKFQSQSVQTFGFVYQSTNGPNHGPVWKTQLFLLSGICTVIFWQDYCGKGNLRKGNFKDVRFYPKLNFGFSWAALWKMSVFYSTRNFRQFWADPVAAIFWVNASRVIPALTIPNVKNLSLFILSFSRKKKKKHFFKKKEKEKRIKTDVFPSFFLNFLF